MLVSLKAQTRYRMLPPLKKTNKLPPLRESVCACIPLRLRDFMFCKVLPKQKRACEMGWQEGCTYGDLSLLRHLEVVGGNYGVITSHNGLCVLDLDNDEAIGAIEPLLPRTFTVDTPRGRHYYFTTSSDAKKIILKRDGVHMGELQAGPYFYVVGPGSTHPSGLTYKVRLDVPVVHWNYKGLKTALRGFYKEKVVHTMKPQNHQTVDGDVDFPITNVISMGGLQSMGGGEYQGRHPVHGSDNGMNFRCNPSLNVWFCYRCNAGGKAIQLLALKEGIISNCEELLRGNDFIKTVNIARMKGWIQ